jgi:lipoprotein Spr
MGIPYKWGGTDRRGIDCSAFVQRLLDTAYNITIPRTSIEQFFAEWTDRFVSTKYLSEGDLVFFATFGDNVVSHVGMYLCNGQFINSSSRKGVSLGDLNDPYWKSRYVAAGRIKQSLLSNYKSK